MVALARNAAAPLWESLDAAISLDDQNVNFTGLLKIDGHKVRIKIRSNPYGFQSHADAEIWSPTDLRWNNVASIGHGSMKTPTGMYVWSERGIHGTWNNPAHFREDADRLLSLVAQTLL